MAAVMFVGSVSRMWGALLTAAVTVVAAGLLSIVPAASVGAVSGARSRLPFTSLTSVSCVASGWCAAVGRYTPGSNPISLAEWWNGRSWAARPTQNPRHAFESELAAVSCRSRHACVAVGGYSFGRGCGRSNSDAPCSTRPIAEAWNGKNWKLEPVPLSAIASHMSALTGVSCVRARFCVAVGCRGRRF